MYNTKLMTRLNYLLTAIVLIAVTPFIAAAQSLSINTDGSAASASAMLDVKSTTKGLLVPRMSRTERDAIAAPATGLLIFQNAPDSLGYYYYNGNAWTWLLSNSNTDSLAWKTGGNSGTAAAANFIGTRDNVDLVVRTNNTEAMRIATNGAMGLGTATPATGPGAYSRLDIRDEAGFLSDITQLVAGGGGVGHNFVKQRGTLAVPVIVGGNDVLGELNGNLYNGTGYVNSTKIRFQADGTIAATSAPGAIRFFTTDTGSNSLTEKLTVKATGNVGVGISSPVVRLDVAGNGSGTNSLLLRGGNSTGSSASNQVLFSWNGGADYRHAIKTRHNGGGANENAIDFYVWNQGVDAPGTIGTKAAMTIDGKSRGMVGVGTKTPNSELHLSDGSTSLKTVYGAYGTSMLITDNTQPRIYFEAAGQPANKKLMTLTSQGQNLYIGSLNDAGDAWDKQSILVANRDGNVGIGVATPAVALDVNGSATIGAGNLNTGAKTIASGNVNTISGNYSTVTGEFNNVSATRSIVAGFNNGVNGENNIVTGVANNIVTGYGHSLVAGYQDTLSGSASAVFGYLNKALAFTTFAAGDRNTVAGQGGVAFGFRNGAMGIGTFATGVQDTAVGTTATVFGTGNNSASNNEFVAGMYSTKYTAADINAPVATDRIFNVGNGIDGANRSDALTILKGGQVGINTATPTALLDINSNTIRLRTAKTPASATAAGNTGDIAWDSDYIYVCVATNTWKRVAIAGW